MAAPSCWARTTSSKHSGVKKTGAAAPVFVLLVYLLRFRGQLLVLFVQPDFQRGEVVEQGLAVDALFAGSGFQRFRPWLGGTHLQHGPQLLAGFFAAVDRALVQRAGVAGFLAQGTME